MDESQKVKAEDIEGLREMISAVIREERAAFAPATLPQDVEELRRSPAGAIIRLEEKVDHLAERFSELQAVLDQVAARMVTKGELAAEIRMLASKGDLEAGLARMASKEDLEAGLAHMVSKEDLEAGLARMASKEDLARMASKEDLARMASKEDLARMASKEDLRAGLDRVVTKEDLDTRLEGLEKQISILRTTFFAVVTLIVGLQTAILIKLLFP